ncbi:hypothetical protein ACB092_04G038400 [Castanea dentata]
MVICHIVLRFKNFLVSILAYISQLLPKSSNSPPTQSQSSQTMDLESRPVTPVPAVTRQSLERRNLQWQDIIMGFCFTSALEIAIQSTQTASQLSSSLHWLSLAVVLTFSTLFVAKFMSTKYPVHAQLVEKVAVIFATTVFFLAIAITLPPSFHIFIWAIYAVLLLCGFIHSFF